MKYVEVVAESGSADTILPIAERTKAQDRRFGMVGEDGLQQLHLLVTSDKLQ